MTITSSELLTARTRLGLSPSQFASELGMPTDWYVDFEAGLAKLPKKEAEWVAYRLACAERDNALAKSGLERCQWMEQWSREEPPATAKSDQRLAYFEKAGVHAKTCPTCLARARFVKEHFPNMPKPPAAGWIRLIGAIGTWIDARPEWSRPAFYGAIILAAMTLVRVPFLLLRGFRDPKFLLVGLAAIVAAAVAGAGGGLIYSLAGRPARRVPVLGPYLAGLIAVAGYMGCILGIMAVGGANILEGSVMENVVIFGLVTVFFGLIVGHMWFRPKRIEA